MSTESTKMVIVFADHQGFGRGTLTINLPPSVAADEETLRRAFVAVERVCETALLDHVIRGHALSTCDSCDELWADTMLRRRLITDHSPEYLCPRCRKDGK